MLNKFKSEHLFIFFVIIIYIASQFVYDMYFRGFDLNTLSVKSYTIYEEDEGCAKLDKDCSAIDKKYKMQIIAQSDIKGLTLEDLNSVMGPCEIEKFIRENDGNPKIYTPTKKNIKQGIYKANLHIHSLDSDGTLPFYAIMAQAQEYAEKNNMTFYVATTDHNTVNGAKAALIALKENPNKFKNVKVILGIEINSIYNYKAKDKDKVEIHVLAYGINPYDKFLNQEFYKSKYASPWNRPRKNPDFEDFDNVIKVINDQAIVGIAHPARYISNLKDKKYLYLEEMFNRYKRLTPEGKPLFVEGYYQAYEKNAKVELKRDYKNVLKFINSEAKKQGICRVGNLDTHGKSIFRK